MPYDVFITCGSEDYEKAEPVYHWLLEQGYCPFFAPVSLNIPKTSSNPVAFSDEIDYALDSAESMVVFCSNAEYVKNGSVKDEWRIFLEEQRAGRKSGSLVTILEGVAIADLPIRLRSVQSFTTDGYKQGILHFLRSRGHEEKNEIEEQPAREEIDESKYVLVGEGKSVLTKEDVDKNATHIRIADGVTSIGSMAFYKCSKLTSIAIPNSVISIGYCAFSGCERLTSVVLPNSITSIELHAFEECSGLTSIFIPNKVSSISESAFSGCSGLASIIVDIENKIFDSRDNSNAIIETSTNKLIAGCCRTIIPNSVTSIDSGAFDGCNKLTSIIIPDNVTSIGYGAFSRCNKLTSIIIPNNVTSIGCSVFSGCSELASIIVSNKNPKYDSRNNCNAIIETSTNKLIAGCSRTIIPNSVTSIGKEAFYGRSNLTSLVIPNSVTSINDRAFSYCNGLTSIVISNHVNSIGQDAFFMCSSLTSIVIPYGVASIEDDTFQGCSRLKSITIPESVISIGNGAFCCCRELTSIIIPNSVTYIDDYAFCGCCGLTSVIIPNNVSSIGDYAFSGCSGLTSIVISNSVTSIGTGAFEKCNGLASVIIPDSVISIGLWAFDGCSNLKTVYIPDLNLLYSEDDENGEYEELALFPSHTQIFLLDELNSPME